MSLLLALQGGGADVTVNVTGSLITAASGTVSVTGGAVINVTGNSLTTTSGSVSITGDAQILPSGSGISLANGIVTVETSSAAITIPAGRRRRIRRWVLDVEGKDVIFQSIEALLAFLAAREPGLEAVAEAKAERDAERVLRVGPAAARPAPPRFVFSSEQDEVREALVMLERAVAARYRSALAVALSRDAEEIDDILFIARILDD